MHKFGAIWHVALEENSHYLLMVHHDISVLVSEIATDNDYRMAYTVID